jgi:hypothetical protein
VDSHIKILQLLVGLPKIEQSPEEEAQRQRFNDDFEKAKSFVKIFGFVSKVKMMKKSLFEHSIQRLLEKLPVASKNTCDVENHWSEYR